MNISTDHRAYWDTLAQRYQQETTIAADDFHYGPLVPGDRDLQLLPVQVEGLRCLEVGCGAGQNSIYLSGRGAECSAIDISAAQLERARCLADQNNVTVSFCCTDMDSPGSLPDTCFDIVHSSYALSFSSDPQRLIGRMAQLLSPSGLLLLSTAHPLFASEWLEINGEGYGAFVRDYFSPTDDHRTDENGTTASSRAYPVSTIANWMIDAGLRLVRILEPRPCPLNGRCPPPYTSRAWEALRPQLDRVPVVVIYAAQAGRGQTTMAAS